jgi:hypothetical protein
MDKAEHRVELV